ncbi:MAG: hypothetical protein WAV51_03005 [Microgenomates group bacterium]
MREKIPVGRIFLLLFYQIIFVGISFFLLKRVGAFGCFDDCFNFGAGDFILQGKQLYSQIFFNHQPFMAYISAAIQYTTDPTTLFELVKYHRIAALVFANICGSFLIFRFGLPMFISLVVFESTKFYLFGDRFLAEGFIVYPMMYLMMLIGQVVVKKRIYAWEYLLAAVCSWFIFWTREPFMPWALIVLGILFVIGYKEKAHRKYIGISAGIFLLFHVLTILVLPAREYVFNVITINVEQEVGVQLWNIQTFLQIVFYPVFVIAKGFGTIFQNVLLVLSVIFCGLVVYELLWKKRYGLVGVLLGILAVSNIRVVPAGVMYYDAFHLIPWYGLFIVSIAVFIKDMEGQKIKSVCRTTVGIAVVWIAALTFFSPQSLIKETVDTQVEFTTGYGNYFVKGEIIKMLSEPGDTMFVEMWEDPVYFVAGVPTAYKYSWYTSVMPFFSMYRIAREEMFENNPPTFYVGACRAGDIVSFALSSVDAKNYIQLLNSGRPSCVYIQKTVTPRITKKISDEMNAYGYSLP